MSPSQQMSPKETAVSPVKRRKKKKKKKTPTADGGEGADGDEGGAGGAAADEEESDEDDDKKWVEAFRFSFNQGSVSLVQCPLYTVCPAGADPGDVIEVDLLGIDELCESIPRTKPVYPPGQEPKKRKNAGPEAFFPEDGGLVRPQATYRYLRCIL